MPKRWFVRIPIEFGGEAHPRYWSVVRVEDEKRLEEVERGWGINDAGECVSLPAFYRPVESKRAGERFISAAWRRWKGRSC